MSTKKTARYMESFYSPCYYNDLRSHFPNALYVPAAEQKEVKVDPNEDYLTDTILSRESQSSVLMRFERIAKQFLHPFETEDETFKRLRKLFYAADDKEALVTHQFEHKYNYMQRCLATLKQALSERNLFNANSGDPVTKARIEKFYKIAEVIHKGYRMMCLLGSIKHVQDPRNAMFVDTKDIVSFDIQPMKFNDFQEAREFCLNHMQGKGYRKRGTRLYRPIFTSAGINSRAWEDFSDIETELLKAFEPAEQNARFAYLMTVRPGMLVDVTKNLEKTANSKFPFHTPDRHIRSFENGVYLANSNEFLEWGNENITASMVACRYYPYPFQYKKYQVQATTNTRPIGPNSEECLPFDWYNIETPAIQGILNDQGFEQQVCEFYYVADGRCLRELGQDNWQGIKWLKGNAGTGKSTGMQNLANMFDPADVGIFTDDVEYNFPLESVLDCHIWLCMDVSEDFRLAQTLWQSMVSGEKVAVNRKNKTRIFREWKIPGAGAGNMLPRWSDNAGSLSRRMWIWDYHKTVHTPRPDLPRELAAQIPAYIYKSNIAYLDYVRAHGAKDPRKWLDPYFAKTAKKLKIDTNPLECFIASSKCRTGAELYVPENHFRQEFAMFCYNQGLHLPKWTQDFYQATLDHHSLKRTEDLDRMPYPSNTNDIIEDYFLIGIDVVSSLSKAANAFARREAYPKAAVPAMPIGVR